MITELEGTVIRLNVFLNLQYLLIRVVFNLPINKVMERRCDITKALNGINLM